MANERGPKYDFSVVSTSGADETTLTEVDSSLLSFGTTPRYPGKGKRPYPSSKGARSTGGKSTFLSTPGGFSSTPYRRSLRLPHM